MGTINIKPAETNLNEEEVMLVAYYLEYMSMYIKQQGSLSGKLPETIPKSNDN